MDLYLKSIAMVIKSEMEYRISFIFSALSATMNSIIFCLEVLFLIEKFGNVGEWSFNEIMLITGIVNFGSSITEMFFRGLDMFYTKIRTGEFDILLTRPRNELYQIICSDFEGTKIGRLLYSIVLIVVMLFNLNIKFDLLKLFTFIMILFGAVTTFLSLCLIKAGISFWVIDGMEFMNIFLDGGREFASYPINVFKKWFAKIFTFIVPFGAFNYYPILYLLEKDGAKFYYSFTPLFTLVILGFSFLLWKKGVKAYKSTGN
jgi:ABC-2 type transport system permease protein